MVDLLAALQSVGIPTIGAAVLVIVAYFIRENLKTKEAQLPPSDSDIKQNSAILKNLMEDLREAKNAEDDCARQITAMVKERDALLIRVTSLAGQVDQLFVIMNRNSSYSGQGTTDRDLGRQRAWMIEHVSNDLEIVAADAGLAKPIFGVAVPIQVLTMVTEATQRNMLPKLEDVLLRMRPTVPKW